MKKSLFYIVALIVALIQSSSAQFELGTEARVNINDPYFSGISNLNQHIKPFIGSSFGVFAENDLGKGFSLKSGVYYKKQGFSISEGTSFDLFGMDIPVGIKVNTSINYIDIPLLLKYHIPISKVTAFVQAGPSLSHAMNGEIKPIANLFFDVRLPSIPVDFGDNLYRRDEWSGNLGVGAEIDVSERGKIIASLNYTHAFSSIIDSPIMDLKIKNRALSLGLGYAMTL